MRHSTRLVQNISTVAVVFCFYWEIYFIQFILVYKWFDIFLFFDVLVELLSRTKNTYRHYFFWIYCCFFAFLSIQENLCLNHHNSNLSYGSYRTFHQHNQSQNYYPLLIVPNLLDTFAKAK